MTSVGLPEARTIVNVLVTGARVWTDEVAIEVAFRAEETRARWALPGPYWFRLIQGACPVRFMRDEHDRIIRDENDFPIVASADYLAERVARRLQWENVESAPGVAGFPADWDRHGRGAGHIRNDQMVKYLLAQPGERVCVGFPMDGLDVPYEGPLPDKGGTWDCLKRAREAGIRTWWAYPGMGVEPEGAI